MNGLWIYAPTVLTVLLAVTCFVVGAWCCVLAADYVNHFVSEVEASASGATRPVSGAGTRVSESERGDTPAVPSRDGQHLAVVAGPSETPTPT